MAEMLTYNLTQHTSFRELEFEFAKTKDENEQLRARLQAVERMFRQTAQQFTIQHKNQLQQMQKAKEASERQIEECLLCVDKVWQQEELIGRVEAPLDKPSDSPQISGTDLLKLKANALAEYLSEITSRKAQDTKYSQRELDGLREQVVSLKQFKDEAESQIKYLNGEVRRLEQELYLLSNQLSEVKRENSEYKLQSYELRRETENTGEGNQVIEDNGFALDLLQYQKEMLEAVFTRLIKCLQGDSLCESIAELYHCYAAVAEHYRQKIQIEYDLQDLEKEYRKERSSRVSEQLLIQLRKQIQSFRKELHRQKEELTSQEEQLEVCFQDIQAAHRHEGQLRGYAIDVERKLRELQKYDAKPANTSTKKGQPQETYEQGGSRIKFRATSTEEQMRQAIRKDREALNKMFREKLRVEPGYQV